MTRLNRGAPAIAILCLLAGACDGGASAVPVQKAGAVPTGAEGRSGTALRLDAGSATSAERRAPAPEIDGRPMWSATRRFTAEQNARRVFERNGAAFGVSTVDAFVEKAHAFVSRPPRGALTLTRSNGDTLIYDPAANVFAVVNREGAPRTMFKPDEGAGYWETVKAQEAARASSSRRREPADRDG